MFASSLVRRSALVGLVVCSSALPSAAQQVRPGARGRVEPVTDAASFRALATRFDFEDVLPANHFGMTWAFPGLAFQFGSGSSGGVWVDTMPREGLDGGTRALRNHPGAHLRGLPAASEGTHALRVGFSLPATRAAFQLRCVGAEHANLVLSAWRGTEELGRAFFDVGASYQVVGLECGLPFDELRVAFTNPSRADFSLDEVLYDTDLGDRDRDGVLDFVDLCPGQRDTLQADSDGDGRGDACDPFPLDAANDEDGDGIGAELDLCPRSFDPAQLDADHDGVGDACDSAPLGPDSDGDGIEDFLDNCPALANPGQEDCDGDGTGDLCDSTMISPADVRLTLRRGQSVTIAKTICLPSVPPKIDFVLAMDLTGSMGGEITRVKEHVLQFARDILERSPGADYNVGLVTYRDYPHAYSSCGYNGSYGNVSDHAFRVDAPLGTPPLEIFALINGLTAVGGSDGPESYTRLFWELGRPDSGIGFRPGARRVVLNTCDNIPHDCAPSFGIACNIGGSTGIDPGRDEQVLTADDIDLQDDSLLPLLTQDIRLFTLYTGTNSEFCAWEEWCVRTGGDAVLGSSTGTLPPGVDLADLVFDLIGDPVVEVLALVANPGCGLVVTFDPQVSGPYAAGSQVTVQETITVPADLPASVDALDCSVFITADNAVIGVQTIHVDLDCSVLTFEGLENGRQITPAHFAGQGVSAMLTPGGNGGNVGLAVFDSDPTGPNQGSSDPDLLVNRGNVLIFQENPGQNLPGVFHTPDDAQLGGRVAFTFAAPSELGSLDLIDVDHGPPIQEVVLVLFDEVGRTRTYFVPDGWTEDVSTDGLPGYRTLDLTTLAAQPGFASSATASQQAGFDAASVVRLEVSLSSSGALDNLRFCPPL